MSIKEKFIKAKKKVVNFMEEHPKITAALVFMGMITTCTVVSATRSNDGALLEEKEDEKERQEWKQYEENWNKVNEFAETLKLLPGESFIIEDPEQYRLPRRLLLWCKLRYFI